MRLGASESAAMPPAGASTGRPAASAMLQRRRQPGLDADDLDAALVPGGDAADQAAAADRDQQRVEVGRLRSNSRPTLPWPSMVST